MKAYKYPRSWCDQGYDSTERLIDLGQLAYESKDRQLIDGLTINSHGFVRRISENPVGMVETTVDKDKVQSVLFQHQKKLENELAAVKALLDRIDKM